MEKSSDALRTISEVATDLDIPKHVLRFWESKFTQINPMKRGGGRRYYRPSDIQLLKGIRHLLYGEGFTIRGVQQIFKREGIDYVKGFASGNNTALPLPDAGKQIKSIKRSKKPKKRQAVANVHPKQKILISVLDEIEQCRKILTTS